MSPPLLPDDRYKHLFMHSPTMHVIASVDGYFKELNAAWVVELGYSCEELLAKPYLSFVHADDVAETLQEIERLTTCTQAVAFKNRYIHKNGQAVWLSWYVFLDHQTGLLYGTAYNISEHKKQERLARHREQLLEETGSLASVGGWGFDVKSDTPIWTKEVYHIHEVDDYQQPDIDKALDFYPPEVRPKITSAMEHCIKTGEGWDLELPFITAKNNHLWVRTIGNAEFEQGQAVRLFGAMQDITDKYQLKAQLENAFHCLRQLYQVSSDPYQHIRQKLERVLKVACDYLQMEYGVINHIEADTQYALYASDETVRQNAPQTYQASETICQYTYTQDEVLEILDLTKADFIIPAAVLEANLRSYVGCALNIGEERFGTVCFVSTQISKGATHYQKEIVRLFTQWISAELENDRNKEQLKTALSQTQRASEAKSKFISSVSHELRTPLNSIIGFTNRLVKNLADKIEPRHLDALQTVERNGEQLLMLINDILDISRLEAGKIVTSKEHIKLDTFLLPIIKQLSPLSEQKGLSITVGTIDADVFIFADRKMLTQIVINLVSNAIKYTHTGSIHIQVSVSESIPAHIVIQIQDTGIGISEKDQTQLFTTFFRSDHHLSHNISGTGLGLSIVKEFVSLHGGEVTVSSVLGEGSTFTVLLPQTALSDT